MSLWTVILVLGLWSYALRLTAPLLMQGVKIPERAATALSYITPAVLSALVAAGMFTTGRDLVADERVFGFAAACVAAVAKMPPLVVIVVAAAATAAARALL